MTQKLSPGAGSTEARKRSTKTERDLPSIIANFNSTAAEIAPGSAFACDRAAAAARAVMQTIASGGDESDVAEYLREEFADATRQSLTEIREFD
jgi:hypothetical protein